MKFFQTRFALYALAAVGIPGLLVSGTSALSFGPDTIFLDPTTKSECELQGGSFTDWYGEIYCTTTPEMMLTDEQLTQVNAAASTINGIIGADEELFVRVVTKLSEYRTTFANNGSMQKAAMAVRLSRQIEILRTPVPETCTSWFDGCNTCMVGDNGELACTRMACAVMEAPTCMVYEKTWEILPQTAACMGVGAMDCLQYKDISVGSDDEGALYLFQDIEGFTFVEGTRSTITVREEQLDPATVPADGSSIRYTLVEIIDQETEIAKVTTCTDPRPEICTMDYTPVCGDDGVTYGNACGACGNAEVASWTEGECGE